jgi:hypothetical protein
VIAQYTLRDIRGFFAISMALLGHNRSMARGWESKGVEQQQDENLASPIAGKPRITAQQAVLARQREDLQLRRKRVVAQLEKAQNSQYRAQLEAALAELDLGLAKLT